MNNIEYEVPILFLIFNRPDTTERVFIEIKKQKPKFLYIAADGPREHVEGERDRCKKTRKILDKIDWDCEVKTLFRDKNLGCKKAVSSAIDWFFKNVEEGVILEDDCLPDESFFMFCENMLKRYRNDNRVGMISGNNFLFNKNDLNEYSYYFSRYTHIWGWASWRRAWQNYDAGISLWAEFKNKKLLKKVFSNRLARFYWDDIFEKVYHGKINTWDYQWFFTNIVNNFLTVIPKTNLISNIGFNPNISTHTKWKNSIFANMDTEKMEHELKHPPYIFSDKKADSLVQFQNYSNFRWLVRKFINIFYRV